MDNQEAGWEGGGGGQRLDWSGWG